MYILVKDDVPSGHSMNCAAHAAVLCYNKYKDDPIVQEWVSGPYYKVCCKVTPEEFEEFKKYDDYYIIEEDMLDDREISMAFKPRRKEEYPGYFKSLPLWSAD
jgi:hypothetical protein